MQETIKILPTHPAFISQNFNTILRKNSWNAYLHVGFPFMFCSFPR